MLTCDASAVEVQVLQVTEQFIHYSVIMIYSFIFPFIYGPNDALKKLHC